MSAKIDIWIDSTNPGPTYISQSSYKIWPVPNTGLTGLYKKKLRTFSFLSVVQKYNGNGFKTDMWSFTVPLLLWKGFNREWIIIAFS